MDTASIVLISAGLDSTVNLKRALDEGAVAAGLTFDYGQRAAGPETRNAAAMCARFRIRHETIRLPWLARITRTALVGRKRPLPRLRPAELDDPAAASRSALRVWVPNRNGVFLAVAAAYAEALGADRLVAGFNAEEAATFPDNSEEFARAYTRSLRFSTRNAVRVKCYTSHLRKPAIVALGLRNPRADGPRLALLRGRQTALRTVRIVHAVSSGPYGRRGRQSGSGRIIRGCRSKNSRRIGGLRG